MKIFNIIFAAALLMLLPSCIEDGVATDAASQPEFSTATLDLGTVFTDAPSPTYRFTVYNRHDKILSISDISMEKGADSFFRLNVDGEAGTRFSQVEVRPNDSIYVFVETTVPKGAAADYLPFEVSDRVRFVTNGQTRSVGVVARGQLVDEVRDAVITADTRWDEHPRRIFGELKIAPGATLSVGPGVNLYFHDGAGMQVEGTLIVEGIPDTDEQQGMVVMRGDRLDMVVGTSEYDLLASQWRGITFLPGSAGSRISHADIRGTAEGIALAGDGTAVPDLTLVNSRLHRSGANLLTASLARLTAAGCEFSDSKGSLLLLDGAQAAVASCTFANYYISSYDVGALVTVDDINGPSTATIDNCLLLNYRNTAYITPGDLAGTAVTFRRALLPIGGSDDDNFIDCLWSASVTTRVSPSDFIYDYRLLEGSAGIGQGDPALLSPLSATDLYGKVRDTAAPAIGAYEY